MACEPTSLNITPQKAPIEKKKHPQKTAQSGTEPIGCLQYLLFLHSHSSCYLLTFDWPGSVNFKKQDVQLCLMVNKGQQKSHVNCVRRNESVSEKYIKTDVFDSSGQSERAVIRVDVTPSVRMPCITLLWKKAWTRKAL